MTKICTKCKETKDYSLFHKQSSARDGRAASCSECCRIASRKHYQENRLTMLEKDKIYHQNPRYKAQRLTRRDKENAQKRIYTARPEVKARRKEYMKEYNKNSPKYKEYQREWKRKQQASNPAYVLSRRVRNRVRAGLLRVFDKVRKSKNTSEYLGCTFTELKDYIESLFKEGMTWEKLLNQEIELDHIMPLSYFDLTKEEEMVKAFHFTNLQPLWTKDNRLKSDRLDYSIESPYN